MVKLFFILVFSVSIWAETNPSTLVLGLQASGSESETTEIGEFIRTSLQGTLKVPVKIYISKNYSDIIDALAEKKVDFAFLTALTYVVAEKKAGIKVLLKKVWNEPFYYSVILTNSSKIKSLKDLKKKRLAFVDQKSTSGFLYPSVALKKLGLKDSDFSEVKFSGNHSLSVELLEKNQVDAIAVFSDDIKGKKTAWQKYAKDPKKPIRVLWASDEIPNDPLIVRQEFYDSYPKLVHNLMFTMIDLLEVNQANTVVKKFFGTHSMIPATSRQYDPVREMVKELNPQVE